MRLNGGQRPGSREPVVPHLRPLDIFLRGGDHHLREGRRGICNVVCQQDWPAHLVCVDGREPEAHAVRPGDVERKRDGSMAAISQ